MSFVILSVLGVLVLLGGYLIILQRGWVRLDELCSNALSQIGVQQSSRWDGLTALADVAKGYAEHESATLSEIIGKRVPFTPSMGASEVARQEQLLASGLGRLMAVAEAYPDLKADALYQKTMEGGTTSEDKVRMSRMVYNDTVTRMNRSVRMFPGSLFAPMMGFYTRPYLEEPAGKTDMPDLSR